MREGVIYWNGKVVGSLQDKPDLQAGRDKIYVVDVKVPDFNYLVVLEMNGKIELIPAIHACVYEEKVVYQGVDKLRYWVAISDPSYSGLKKSCLY